MNDPNVKCREHYAKIRAEKQQKLLPEGYEILLSGIVREGDLLWRNLENVWSSKHTKHFIGCDIEGDTWGVCRQACGETRTIVST